MKTRKIWFYLPAMLLFFSLRGLSEGVTGGPINLPGKEAIGKMSEEQKQVLIQQMKDRADEIKAMDKSQLTKQERKELRTELKDMKKESRRLGSITIGIGALIIIILLIIIL